MCVLFNPLQVAKELWEVGFVQFPIPTVSSDRVTCLIRPFIQEVKARGEVEAWSFRRMGEAEDDAGLIYKNGTQQGGDHKFFFHYDDTLPEALAGKGVVKSLLADELFTHYHKLYLEISSTGYEICRALDFLYDLGVAELYRQSSSEIIPYATSQIRGLCYPDDPQQQGARVHVDKGLLTIHCGDIGGQLFARLPDGSVKSVSPARGYAVAFFGVKILWVTKGEKQPLWHYSTTESGCDRLAQVYFGHVPLRGYQVRDNVQALRDFKNKFYPLIVAGKYHWRDWHQKSLLV